MFVVDSESPGSTLSNDVTKYAWIDSVDIDIATFYFSKIIFYFSIYFSIYCDSFVITSAPIYYYFRTGLLYKLLETKIYH